MSAELRVLVIAPDFPPSHGGIQLLVERIVRHARRLRCRVVTLHAAGADPADRAAALDVQRVRPVPGPRQLSVVALNARALREARRWRPELVLSAHIVAAPAAAAIRRTLGVPVVQYLHAEEVGARRRLAAFAVRQAAANVAVSRYTRQLALEAGGEPGCIHVIPPGVDLPAPPDARRAVRPTVLTVSRLAERYKGHDVMVRALPLIRARVPDVEWVLVGDGRLRPALERLASAQGLDGSVRFVGAVPDADRDAWLGRARVFAMPSRLPAGGFAGEGFGIVYLEAAAHGLPVVAGNVGGALDAVVDGQTGLLVDPTDHVAVADAVSDLLADQSRAETLGRAGSDRAREFAWPAVARRVEELLLRVARDARAASANSA